MKRLLPIFCVFAFFVVNSACAQGIVTYQLPNASHPGQINLPANSSIQSNLTVNANASIDLAIGGAISAGAGATVDLLGSNTTLPITGVTPGSYTSANITVGADGRISAAANGSGGGSGTPPFNITNFTLNSLLVGNDTGVATILSPGANGTALQIRSGVPTYVHNLIGSNGNISDDFYDFGLKDTGGNFSVDYDGQKLLTDASGFTLTALNWHSYLLLDGGTATSEDWKNRILFAPDGSTPALNWNSTTVLTSNLAFNVGATGTGNLGAGNEVLSSLTANNFIYGNATKYLTSLAATNNALIGYNGTGVPTASLTWSGNYILNGSNLTVPDLILFTGATGTNITANTGNIDFNTTTASFSGVLNIGTDLIAGNSVVVNGAGGITSNTGATTFTPAFFGTGSANGAGGIYLETTKTGSTAGFSWVPGAGTLGLYDDGTGGYLSGPEIWAITSTGNLTLGASGTANLTLGNINVASLTASEIVGTDASKNLVSLTTLPAFTLGGNVALNGKTLTGLGTFNGTDTFSGTLIGNGTSTIFNGTTLTENATNVIMNSGNFVMNGTETMNGTDNVNGTINFNGATVANFTVGMISATGTANGTTFLAGNGTWQTISAGSSTWSSNSTAQWSNISGNNTVGVGMLGNTTPNAGELDLAGSEVITNAGFTINRTDYGDASVVLNGGSGASYSITSSGYGPGNNYRYLLTIFSNSGYPGASAILAMENSTLVMQSSAKFGWGTSTTYSENNFNTNLSSPSAGVVNVNYSSDTSADGTIQAAVGNFTNETGTATNNNATSGSKGEFVESHVDQGSEVSLTTNTTANLTSISLTAGDWDVTEQVYFDDDDSVGTPPSQFEIGVTSTSATMPTDTGTYNLWSQLSGLGDIGIFTFNNLPVRFSLSDTTTIYAVVNSIFSTGTVKVFGQIRARRVR